MKIFKGLLAITAIMSFQTNAFANEIPIGVFVGGEDSVSAPPAQGISVPTGGKFILRVHASCFPTNLRGVANPIAPSSIIKANFKMKISDKDFDFFVSFPGYVTAESGMKAASIQTVKKSGSISVTKNGPPVIKTCTAPSYNTSSCTSQGFSCSRGGGNMWGGFGSCTYSWIQGGCNNYGFGFANSVVCTKSVPTTYTVSEPYENHNLPDGSYMGIYGKTIQVNLGTSTALTRNADGSAAETVKPPTIENYSFTQRVTDCANSGAVYGTMGYSSYKPTYNCGAYMAQDGAVTASVTGFRVASDNSSADISVAFPGQTGFCGGYWSPLMAFFDDERPEFTNISDFPLNPAGRTSWVEANSKGYFLVHNKNKNGIIDSKDQLFGDSTEHANGFEQLKTLDSNKDGIISDKDKEYSNLYLWNDKNGDGISDKSELIPLKKKIHHISLKYESGNVKMLSKFAEERERAKFYYKKGHKMVSGDIIDIWLAPQPARALADSQ